LVQRDPEEREKLAVLSRRLKSAQAIAMRARIVRGCEDGLSNSAVAAKLRITGATVCKWRERTEASSDPRFGIHLAGQKGESAGSGILRQVDRLCPVSKRA